MLPSDSKWLPKICFVHITETERARDLKFSTKTSYDSMDIMTPYNHNITMHVHGSLVIVRLVFKLHVGHEPSGSKLYFLSNVS